MRGALRLGLALLPGVAGCASDAPPAGPEGARVAVSVSGLRALDPAREGRYQAWVIDRAGAAHPLGALDPASGRLEAPLPAGEAAAVEVTVEPPGDADPAPSAQRLLRGEVRGRAAELSVAGAVTAGELPLRERPGQFTMFSPSDNHLNGYPSYENAGIWLFNMAPRETEQRDMWVRLTPLRPGWTYEGWMVRDHGAPGAVWLSYGKFLPDFAGAVNSRDDTGWGPFSGVLDFLRGEEEFPGDDWISNPLSLPVPGNLRLPLDLTERTAAGESRWTHVITIEPATDRGERLTTERPFPLEPYRDPFGSGGPGAPRAITLHPREIPRGTAEVVR